MDQNQTAAAEKTKLTPSFEMIETAIKVWWKNLKKFILVYVWGILFALIPLAIGLAFVGLNLLPGVKDSLTFSVATMVVFVAALAFIIYFTVRAYIGIFLVVKHDYQGHEKDIFKETKKWFWPYLGLTLLTSVFVLLWTCLLIIPGIIFSIFYSLAAYVLFFEDKRGMAAIRRSVQLIKKYWWAVFGRFLLLGLVMWVFTVLLSIPLVMTVENSFFFHFWNVVVQVINMLIGPIALLFSYQIYQELVKIKK